MKLDIKLVLKLHPEIRKQVLELADRIHELDNREEYFPHIQSAILAEICAEIYNDDSIQPKNATRCEDMTIKFKKREDKA